MSEKPDPRPARDRAEALARARAFLHTEAVAARQQARAGSRRSRQQLRRKRAAEQVAADLLASRRLPVAPDMSRRRLTSLLLQASTMPDTLSRADQADLDALLSHRLKTGGKTGKAAYWSALGPPPVCEPGDTTRARLFARRIRHVRDRGGWTPHERAALHVLEIRWLARASGTDARFMEVGSAGSGRLPAEVERRIRVRQERGAI